ncbi:MAG TPA: hypothetical protein VL200_00735 [Lacunisphaera sp.]|jgi:hypothetical protein|nr:hypothetical protein [Lacunisphaera sp.]
MDDVRELKRLASPAPKPQSLAWDGSSLWMGSKQTKRIYRIDPASWTVTWEVAPPGLPYGMTIVKGEPWVISGETDEDHRIVRRCIPGQGFDPGFGIPCPDDTGSQLGWDGRRLHVSQWYPKKVLAVSSEGRVERTIRIPHEICGQVFVGELLYLLTTDNEETTDYWLTRVDPRPQNPIIADIARVPFHGRALAFDGVNFWSNHREQNQIVCFARPD